MLIVRTYYQNDDNVEGNNLLTVHAEPSGIITLFQNLPHLGRIAIFEGKVNSVNSEQVSCDSSEEMNQLDAYRWVVVSKREPVGFDFYPTELRIRPDIYKKYFIFEEENF